jgi:hypothetical protein
MTYVRGAPGSIARYDAEDVVVGLGVCQQGSITSWVIGVLLYYNLSASSLSSLNYVMIVQRSTPITRTKSGPTSGEVHVIL